MSNKIKVSGRNFVFWDGEDHTGALKELGIDYKGYEDKITYAKICNSWFEVDLDFILRHGALDNEIYEKHYKGSEEYLKYYNEGKQAFLNGNPQDNPYIWSDLKTDPDEYWTNKHKKWGCPWFDGYRETEKEYNENKYKLTQMQNEIREIVKKYGLVINYTDEYGTPYAQTPEGYTVELA